ncbi:uncharacterized protein LOC121243607 [Juglans microcarpa x Juglans regia]|uniref:uncharacterized protein LOC121243607 n=1 Tax=Juglans microcarpa x Juglans regia TaxID=2249226 RepID=UPI001B7E422A|nr:uncharacterized protein LOC121243607 [Juglans microcarpa x Juglans regia]XP_040997668.1 uncharacterized protein LOC121243607 [Juglans microcarpa x Juglans regia]
MRYIMATDSDDSSFPFPNKRRKTLSSTSKSKIQDNPNHSHFEAQEQLQWPANSNSPCMICLSDSAKSIRGIIDCCDHHFCFVCIMEWAKIESRCPICKRRFSTIHRPFKDGVFYRERVVKVPARDQIYTPYGNTTAGPSDPFSQVLCSICHQMTDDSLLLLCDLCDSASHTYCVGLGFTVPEGDWFCHDCTVCRTQLVNREMHADSDSEKVIPTPEEHVTIFNIVREPNSPAVAREATKSSNLNLLSPPVAPDRGNSIVVEVNGPAARTLQNVADGTTQSGARTLQRCRDVHSHIQALRENWHAFRNGSLSFSSLSSKPGCGSGQKLNIRAISHERSDQQNSSSSTSCQQLTTEASFPGSSGHNRSSHDIDKAWKMLFKAKSIQHNLEKPSCTNQVSKLHSSTGKAAKDAPSSCSTFHSLKNKQFGAEDVGRIAMKKHYDRYSPEKDIGNCQSGKVKKQKQSSVTTKETVESSESEGVAATHSLASFKSSFSRNKWSGIQGNVCAKNGSRLLQGYVNGASLNFTDKDNESTCSMSLVGSMPRVADSLYAKTDLSTSVPGEVDYSNERVRSGKDLTESNAVKDDEAKSEIRTLVKLNLKLLSRDKKLGIHVFKEIARLATHTILAACGLEHRMSGVHPFPSSVCRHTEHIQQLHKSTLMPNSCRECFCIFVKDVVSSVMFQKVSCNESN